jgi:hypothetical protein
MIANLRLVLDVEVKAGNLGNSSHSLPGLIRLLDQLPLDSRPAFVRGDCDWGTDNIMNELERKQYKYLFKMKRTKHVRTLIEQQHGKGKWTPFKKGWEAKEATLSLSSWELSRRVVLVRRQLSNTNDLVIEHENEGQLNLSFIDKAENIKAFEYSVLVTNLPDDLISIVQHYRDRADCENNFDELKNQWGWCGYTTKQVKSCRLIARIIALIYNWWTLYTRLLMPRSHLEAITSRPLLLHSVGRLTETGRQTKLSITNSHQLNDVVVNAYHKVTPFFKWLKGAAPQLDNSECWLAIINQIMSLLKVNSPIDEWMSIEHSP